MAPEEPFDYFFIDQKFEDNYQKEVKLTTILNILTVVAIFLCCLGLFGLALFVINSRTKEIGIRKTNGATNLQIITIVNKPFLQWILLAYLIACPVSLIIICVIK
jgi:putative ABC transport system permease protein